jgi:Predicted metalloprotease
MKWQGRRGSGNIEDRRGQGGGGMRIGGGAGLGVLAVVLVGWFFGVDLTPLLTGQQDGQVVQTSGELTEQDRQMGDFVSVTLADTEEVWANIFETQLGRTYTPSTLVLYSQVTPSSCGTASGATGPFYCPEDKKIYLDTDFFATLSRQLGAQGDFAAAYVVAHEVGHHVQDELGILSQVNAVRARSSAAESNALSVRIELQADCFAGVWARHAAEQFGSLDEGDIAEAMNAASKIGDDTLQRDAGRRPMPDSFTHGTSEQRQRWFAAGFRTGEIGSCDTFSAQSL